MYTLFLILVIDNIELFCLFRKKNTYPPQIIQGPPGTGKTSIAAALVKEAQEQGLQVLGTMDRLHCPIGSQSPKATWSRCHRRHLSRCLGFRPRSRRMQTQPSTLQPGHHRRIQPTRGQTPETSCKTLRCSGSRHSFWTPGRSVPNGRFW